jgi:DNA-directed RNA polymerase specialized sigma24 family protein
MEALEYLGRVKKIDAMIINKYRDYRRWVEIAEGMGGVAVTERVQTSRNLQQIPNAIGRYVYIEREIDALKAERLAIIATLERLPHAEYKILYMLFVEDYLLKELPSHFHMSYEWVKVRKNRALDLLQNILDDNGSV